MATGMFGNQYQQAVTDETALRRQQAQTGGLTGWAAITNAMSGIGSEIGYQGGQAMGGMTPAQAQQAQFQTVMDSVPDFDAMDPESLQKMSSAMWQGGFYDEGMQMMNQSRTIQKDDALIKLYEAQATEYNGEQEYFQSKLLAAENIDQAWQTARDYFQQWFDDGDEP